MRPLVGWICLLAGLDAGMIEAGDAAAATPPRRVCVDVQIKSYQQEPPRRPPPPRPTAASPTAPRRATETSAGSPPAARPTPCPDSTSASAAPSTVGSSEG